MRLTFEYPLKPLVDNYLTYDSDPYAINEDIADALMLVIFALHFKLPIINLLDKALKIRDVNFKIVHFVISNNIDLSGLNKIARFLFQVNDILNIRHVGYNLFEVCYE